MARLRPFPFSRKVYSSVAETFHLPSAFIGHLTAQVSFMTMFKAHGSAFGILGILNRKSIAITYDAALGSSYGLVIGLGEHEANKLIEDFGHCQGSVPDIVAVVTSWLSVTAQTRGRRYVKRHIAITDLEKEGGMHRRDDLTKNRNLRSIEFDVLTRKLTVLGALLAEDEGAIHVQLNMIDTFLTLSNGLHKDNEQSGDAYKERTTTMRLNQLRNLLHGLRSGTMYTQQRVKLQLQTVSIVRNEERWNELLNPTRSTVSCHSATTRLATQQPSPLSESLKQANKTARS